MPFLKMLSLTQRSAVKGMDALLSIAPCMRHGNKTAIMFFCKVGVPMNACIASTKNVVSNPVSELPTSHAIHSSD